jgi:hypothetical protein
MVPPNMPPGSYQLVLGLYDAATLGRFPLAVNGQRQAGDELSVVEIIVQP